MRVFLGLAFVLIAVYLAEGKSVVEEKAEPKTKQAPEPVVEVTPEQTHTASYGNTDLEESSDASEDETDFDNEGEDSDDAQNALDRSTILKKDVVVQRHNRVHCQECTNVHYDHGCNSGYDNGCCHCRYRKVRVCSSKYLKDAFICSMMIVFLKRDIFQSGTCTGLTCGVRVKAFKIIDLSSFFTPNAKTMFNQNLSPRLPCIAISPSYVDDYIRVTISSERDPLELTS